MKYLLGAATAVGVASGVIALYNWLLEPLIPDVPLISVTRELPDKSKVIVPYLMADDVGKVVVTLFVGIPLMYAAHKLAPTLVPVPPIK